MSKRDIVVMGASAGGVEALATVVRALPPNLPAAIFVVLHMLPTSRSRLPEILDRSGPLPVRAAHDKEPIAHGHIYVASPDHHLLVEPDQIRVVRGPKENRHRPAVDPLFRSAAYAYGPRVIGVVLSGALDDGTAGMLAVKERGGMTVVQDPDEALYAGMPRSASQHVVVDHCVPVAAIGSLLEQLTSTPLPEEEDNVSDQMGHEVQIAKLDLDTIRHHSPLGIPSVFSCPECGGVLHELRDGDYARFRCRVGHAFSPESVLAEQNEALEEALWSALNMLEENASLSQRLAGQAQDRGQTGLVSRFQERVRQSEQRADAIREVLSRHEPLVEDIFAKEG